MLLAKKNVRGFALSLAALGALLFVASPAGAKRYQFHKLACSLHVPGSWKKVEMIPGEKVKFKMSPSGTFSISHKKMKLPLKKIAKKIKKMGKKKGWKLLNETKNIKHRGKRAHLLSYLIPTKKKGLTVRADYFFVNTPNGYYTLFFGAASKVFKPGMYKGVYSTFEAN
jgi:hypothetical protein